MGYLRAERRVSSKFSYCIYCCGCIERVSGERDRHDFFENLEKWAKENSVIRLELTVECHNEAARKLYEKVILK